jgi:uracil-DNA glycosylase
MRERAPDTLLVGEAPGYRGARVTGVPFTTPGRLLEGSTYGGLVSVANGYRVPDDAPQPRGGEQTATILWRTLDAYGVVPLGWNAYPFHPHKSGDGWTNRAPRRSEIAQGQAFLSAILTLFAPRRVIAVGNVAAGSLRVLGVAHTHVRHPAQGGKADFERGMREVFGDTIASDQE